jgi:CheY-like chemotaxis protein
VPKILVADDNTNIQKMVSLAFEERGIDVVAVGNGEAAVRRIPDMNPDLVLADIFMPVRNGYEVCEFVKKDSRFSHVPVILLVGAFDPLDEKEARRVGADGVLKKPFVPPDPLIAMVISALEKNPKVAAEMAKAREVVPEPEPLPAALEMPLKAEIKPLPEFPEPSPEEATLVYGFGSGKRGNEDPSAADKGPISLDADVAEEDEEGADTGSSTSDWRRNAMDFEIPEETSKSTAFALDDDDATAMFPSEKDVPPKHVRARGPEKLSTFEAATQIAPVVPAFPERPVASASSSIAAVPVVSALPVAPAPEPPIASRLSVPEASPSAPASSNASAAPVVSVPPSTPLEPSEPHDSFLAATMWGGGGAALPADPPNPAPPSAVVIESLPEVKAPAAVIEETKVEPVSKAPEPVAEIPALEIESVTEPAFAARATHWMDTMTTALKESESEESDWTDPAPQVKLDLDAQQPEPEPAPIPDVSVEPVEKAIEVPPAFQEPSIPEELSISTDPVQPEDEAPFVDNDEAVAEWLPVVPAETKRTDAASIEPALEASGPVQVSRVTADPELIAEPEDSGPISKDPALVEPPSVHVTPEPLLVEDAPETTSSEYDKHEEAIEPAFAFTKAPETSATSQSEIEDAADLKPDVDERIPTGPPPNREILATIPFLSPPPEFLAAAAEAQKAEEPDVDAVVRRVIEKLEPQLHDLLSQGLLKPLIENILQNDLAKKDR